MKKNLTSSTCFGMQRDGPYRVVTCGFLNHVSMQRDRYYCVTCRCWHKSWLSAANTPTGHSRWKKTLSRDHRHACANDQGE